MQQPHKVYFIGAGPGDPGLMTVKAAKILQRADVVITDRLVSEDILQEYVPCSAQIIAVGKQGGSSASASQKEINELLVEKAGLYPTVVRLKGGDTSIFSNILDELLALNAVGIVYEIIPGITALSGAAAYTGIPLTAREHAAGVRILTYYKHTAIAPDAWRELATMKDTLVLYMSGASLPEVVDKLLEHDASVATPFVVVEQATTPNQYVYSATLQQYKNQPPATAFISPSLVIIGKVAGLYKQFAWLPNKEERVPYFAPLDTLTELFNDIKNGNNVSRA
ncbi:uroporphyrinogen-III C-methyltransferase [Ilyomonas limi]|uniref:uroporphyrinogen-III C-methyltransferase n=1 Tax=Ilyomonas limi TaxID=2575867 RepID=A0A4U3KYF6_9BACT|nr:uroporphyrinogen-III C-methyltransferase [Ilyomonas limi]TKK67761.1 uroporphyrinogen-III C-methyltransferase [Ilyomonas limi]